MKKHLFTLLAVIMAFSCQRGGFDVPQQGEDEILPPSHEMIVLGEKLEDPYSTVNITRALESLYPSKAQRIQVDPTDLYVRFLPQNDIQYEYLQSLDVDILDHPMDYRIIREGDYYQDPEVPDGDFTWQYSVVPVDFQFPSGIRYEILDRCYIAEHSPTKAQGIDWDRVERESYRLTGNADLLQESVKGERAEPVAPSGRIAVVDEMYDSEPIGVAGVKVVCNSFVKIASTYTDDQGYYEFRKKYSTNIRYRLVFKNVKGFGIGVNLILVPASVSSLGKNAAEGVNVIVDRASDRKLFERCVVNNAGYDYFEYCSEKGSRIKTPPSNTRLWILHNLASSCTAMMQQGVLLEDSFVADYLGDYVPLVRLLMPDIILGLKDNDCSYDAIYSQAVHQLAHASHFSQAGKEFWGIYAREILRSVIRSGTVSYGNGEEESSGYIEVAEMWAYYVQNTIYKNRYPDSDASFGLNRWFFPHIFLYLSERGFSKASVFAALTPDVTNREVLKERLVSLYPEYRSEIEQVFLRYF